MVKNVGKNVAWKIRRAIGLWEGAEWQHVPSGLTVRCYPELGGPWISAAVPDREILDLALYAAARAPDLKAVTFDAFSSVLSAETLLAGVRAIREAFGLPP